MTKEQAEIIVKAIGSIAEAEATIFWNIKHKQEKEASHNTTILEKWKRELVELLLDV